MNYNVLKNSIAAVIKANGNEEITGDLLQQVLLSMVNILGSGYQFMGAAVPTTNPGTPDARVFYIATQAGTYSNFGSPAIVLDGTQIAVLLFASSWTSVVLSVPTKEYVDTALLLKVDKVEGKGLSTNDLTNELVALINGAFQKEDIVQDFGDSETKVVSQAAITAVLLQYAKVDGYYAQLTAGAAENLVGRGSVPASFLRRTTGGTADVGTGSAKIAKLMGNSIVWNQICLNGNFASVSIWNPIGVSYSVNNNVATITKESANFGWMQQGVNLVVGHKYYYAAMIEILTGSGTVGIGFLDSDNANIGRVFTDTKGRVSNILQLNVESDRIVIRPNNDFVGTALVSNMVLIDLTKMFGAGKEPTTVAEFEALFPLHYYANETGKVLPFAAQKLLTTGFNQWDEEWANGSINYNDGAVIPGGTSFFYSKNYIPVFPNTQYYFTTNIYRVACYDINKKYIQSEWFAPSESAGLHTMGPNTHYVLFFAEGATYNNDICINLSWSGYRNGEYEPYELHEAIFDPANWEDANGNKIFPYGGMHGVGTARDFATPDTDGFIRKGTRVFGRVDLGSLSWESGPDGAYFYATTPDDSAAVHEGGIAAICSKYLLATTYTYFTGNDKTMLVNNPSFSNNKRIAIADASFVSYTGAQVAAALSGVYLYYELAEPVETELAEPVGASYYANDFGTEEWQPANGAELYTAPCNMNVAYAMNAVDTLRRLPENYISVGSFENFCSELATKLGAALNKTVTIAATYNSETEEYDYDITIADVGE